MTSSAHSDAFRTSLPAGEQGLLQRLIAEMSRAWDEGARPVAEDYFNLHPQLWDEPEAAIELIYEEVCLRAQHQDTACWEQILERFPQWKDQLQVLLECHQVVGALAAPVRFPEVGEKLGEFELVSELGRGAQGRVFLARQSFLADRPVVVKVTARAGQEHVSLARLQHTNIVPLYSVLELPERNLRALCMPYFGGVTLDRLLEKLRHVPVEARSGKQLAALLVDRHANEATAGPRSPARQFLETTRYVDAICWIGACLADALDYAHRRGLLHLDVKPSNVLLAVDGQPMLLDFHLAQEPIAPGSSELRRIGGTPGYMAPEHNAALEALRRVQPVPTRLDGRADIYSLALTLYEALGGIPRVASASPLQKLNLQVSSALSDLVEKCLAENPDERYQDAATLATDLRRELGNLPLRGVRNRSLKERWRKWRLRRPHLFAIYSLTGIVLFVALLSGALALTHVRQLVTQGRTELEQIRLLLRDGRYQESAARAATSLGNLKGIPGAENLRHELSESLRDARWLRSAAQLHSVTNQLRALYDVPWMSTDGARHLFLQCDQLWISRDRFVSRLKDPQFAQERDKVKSDLLDLAILSSALRVRLAEQQNTAGAALEAIKVLDQAIAEFGTSPPLWYEKYLHQRQARREEQARESLKAAQAAKPETAWEAYALGRALLREGQFEGASAQLQKAIQLEPASLWANFYEGICAFRLKRYSDAAIAFTVCVQQASDLPEAFYNRALTFAAIGQQQRAMEDYSRALQLRPNFTAAAFNRGLLYYHAGKREEARADFQRALKGGLDPAMLPGGSPGEKRP